MTAPIEENQRISINPEVASAAVMLAYTDKVERDRVLIKLKERYDIGDSASVREDQLEPDALERKVFYAIVHSSNPALLCSFFEEVGLVNLDGIISKYRNEYLSS